MKSKGQLIKVLVASALTSLSTGCASYYCGLNQNLPITSKPTQATVTVYNDYNDVVFQGLTPCSVVLRRGDGNGNAARYRMIIEKGGRAPQEVILVGRVNRAYCINLANAGVGYVVDSINGAMWTLTPCNVYVDLDKECTTALQTPGKATVAAFRP